MIDLVVGLGEIGKPLLELLKLKGIDAVGIDIQPKRINKRVEFLHICFPYSHWFVADVKKYQAKYQPRYTVVHSTVRPRTSKKVNAIYSPVRGRHKTMLDDLQYYSKYYSGKRNYSFEKRFMECRITPDSTVLENTKILVDTTYFLVMVIFTKVVNKHFEVDWSFAEEINKKLGNRPILYDDRKDEVGGHCLIPNTKLIDFDMVLEEMQRFMNVIKNA